MNLLESYTLTDLTRFLSMLLEGEVDILGNFMLVFEFLLLFIY